MTRRITGALGAALLMFASGCAEEANYITKFEDIPPGDICVVGGVRLLAGLDEDADNDLSLEEVDRMDTICDGPPGPTGDGQVIRVEDLPIGGRCINGGIVVFTGADSDNSGVLEDVEIEDAHFVCNGTAFEPAFEACEGDAGPTIAVGSIVINTEAELAALTGVRCIRGNIVIDRYPGTNLEPLSSLVAVTGDFLLINSTTLTEVGGLRMLRVVGGEFLIQNNPNITTLAGFDVLENVNGRLSLAGLGITDLQGLETVAEFRGTLQILANQQLTSLHGLENLGYLLSLRGLP